jgi:hypothetical protein
MQRCRHTSCNEPDGQNAATEPAPTPSWREVARSLRRVPVVSRGDHRTDRFGGVAIVRSSVLAAAGCGPRRHFDQESGGLSAAVTDGAGQVGHLPYERSTAGCELGLKTVMPTRLPISPPKEGGVIIVRRIGYSLQRIPIPVSDAADTIEVRLKETPLQLGAICIHVWGPGVVLRIRCADDSSPRPVRVRIWTNHPQKVWTDSTKVQPLRADTSLAFDAPSGVPFNISARALNITQDISCDLPDLHPQRAIRVAPMRCAAPWPRPIHPAPARLHRRSP